MMTVYRNNNLRNFEVLKEFKFSDFGLSEWDKLSAILLKNSNKCVNPSLAKRKRKAIELEPETYIVGLHCNRTLPEGVQFDKNLGYCSKMMASNVKTAENQRFIMLTNRMINERPDKDKLLTKRVKLENLGYIDV
ncbi:hypothetical protein Tco_1132321 [Tanacetum coccineum]|uniref:Uncharacterized protein n=1 Tax=Tanacetum coccineum TaxID=301880 RepID=A0ABQ5JD00_9ASTR